jgi:hypothetical protein
MARRGYRGFRRTNQRVLRNPTLPWWTRDNRARDWTPPTGLLPDVDGVSPNGEFVTVVGVATADGGSSTFTGSATFATVPATATGDGGVSSFTGSALFVTLFGAGSADGGTSTFDTLAEFVTVSGDATTGGASTTFTGTALFVTGAGPASADGGSAAWCGNVILRGADGVTVRVTTTILRPTDPARPAGWGLSEWGIDPYGDPWEPSTERPLGDTLRPFVGVTSAADPC